MTRKTIARNTGQSGRVNISGSELEILGAEIGDDIELDIADTNQLAHALIDSKEASRFLIVTPL
jgi:hypothetical protein